MVEDSAAVPRSAHIEYTRGDATALVPATGAVGGVTPGRQVIANFYCEYAALPEPVTLPVTPDGKLANEEKVAPTEVQVRREIVARCLFTPEHAAVIGAWLLRHAKSAGAANVEIVESAEGE